LEGYDFLLGNKPKASRPDTEGKGRDFCREVHFGRRRERRVTEKKDLVSAILLFSSHHGRKKRSLQLLQTNHTRKKGRGTLLLPTKKTPGGRRRGLQPSTKKGKKRKNHSDLHRYWKKGGENISPLNASARKICNRREGGCPRMSRLPLSASTVKTKGKTLFTFERN